MGERRYSIGPIFPDGVPENKRDCVRSVRHVLSGVWASAGKTETLDQCSRRRGHGPGGEYCTQHTKILALHHGRSQRASLATDGEKQGDG